MASATNRSGFPTKRREATSSTSKKFRKFFQYEGNVSITITFHKYHRSPWDDWIEMSSDEEVNDKDKLNVVVTCNTIVV